MHFISDGSLQRPGYVYEAVPQGGFVGYPAGMEPEVVWNHIDGPLLYLSNGQLHWLTYRERLSLWLGWTTVKEIDLKHCTRI